MMSIFRLLSATEVAAVTVVSKQPTSDLKTDVNFVLFRIRGRTEAAAGRVYAAEV